MKLFYLFIFLLPAINCCAQKLPGYGTDKVRLSDSGKMIVAEIYPVKNPPVAESARSYHWYSAGYIHATQGGYSGKLLNGNYSEYYLNKNLKQQGSYLNGLQDGQWKQWREDGTLVAISSYRAGVKDGAFLTYDDQGKLLQSGKYKKGLMEGEVNFYHADSVKTTYYQKGKPSGKTRRSFWKIPVLFKHRDSTTFQR